MLNLAVSSGTPASAPDFMTYLIRYAAQYGIFGAAFFDVFVTRKFLIPKWSKDDLEKSKDAVIQDREEEIEEKKQDIQALKASLDSLQSLARDQMIPALVRSNQLSADYLQIVTRRSYDDDQARSAYNDEQRAPRSKPKRRAQGGEPDDQH